MGRATLAPDGDARDEMADEQSPAALHCMGARGARTGGQSVGGWRRRKDSRHFQGMLASSSSRQAVGGSDHSTVKRVRCCAINRGVGQ